MLSGNRSLAVIAAVTVLTIAAYAFWPSSKVELSDQGYDVTLALYRVCNQRSVDGLALIEKQLETMAESNPADDPSRLAILDIVGRAKAGQWQDAAIACRQVLDDQVR